MKYKPTIDHVIMQRLINKDSMRRPKIKEVNRIEEYRAKRDAYDGLA